MDTCVTEMLKKLEEGGRHEMLPEEERLELREHIARLKRKAETTALLEAGRR
jgi:hypothetical protein